MINSLEVPRDAIDILIESPRFSHIKRKANGAIDFVSPLPCPFNYGCVPTLMSGDDDPVDVVLLGPRVPRRTRLSARVIAVVDFIDAGRSDPKWIAHNAELGDWTTMSMLDHASVHVFFTIYAIAKRALNRARGKHGITRYGGISVLIPALLMMSACATTSSASGTELPQPQNASAAQMPGVPERFTLHELAPRTWVFNEPQPWASNVLLMEMNDGALVLVNAPATEASTRALLDYIKARFGQRRLVVINSHHHVDSVGGNALLLEHGAEVIASTQTASLIASDTAGQVQSVVRDGLVSAELAPEFIATRLAQPSRTFEAADGLTLHFGDEEVRVLYPGPAHSIDNVVVHVATRGVVFGGCMVRSADTLGPTDHADVAHWPAAIAMLQALQPTFVVPGHGARFDADQLQNTLNLLAAHTSHAEP